MPVANYSNAQIKELVLLLRKQVAHITEQLEAVLKEIERRESLQEELYLAQVEEMRKNQAKK